MAQQKRAREKKLTPAQRAALPPAEESIIKVRPVEVRAHDRLLAGDAWVTVLKVNVSGDPDGDATFHFEHAAGSWSVEHDDECKIELRADGSRFATPAGIDARQTIGATPAQPAPRRRRAPSSSTPATRTRRNVDQVEREALQRGKLEGMRIGEEIATIRAQALAQLDELVREAPDHIEHSSGNDGHVAAVQTLIRQAFELGIEGEQRIAKVRGGQ